MPIPTEPVGSPSRPVKLQKERVHKLISAHSRDDANGVPRVCLTGVIKARDPRVEAPEEVRDDLMPASWYIPRRRLGAADDCGFSPFSIDVKLKHGSPDAARGFEARQWLPTI